MIISPPFRGLIFIVRFGTNIVLNVGEFIIFKVYANFYGIFVYER